MVSTREEIMATKSELKNDSVLSAFRDPEQIIVKRFFGKKIRLDE
jgi:hypothetical protein